MDFYKIITNKGLDSQDLVDGDTVVSSVKAPVSSIESDLIDELRKKTMRKPLAVGYDNTISFLPGPGDRFPAVSMGHFLLADTLSDEDSVRKARSLVDLGCGSGFLGNYAAKNFEGVQDGRVIFGDLFPESINAALNAYLENNGLEIADMLIKQKGDLFSLRGKGNQVVEFRVGDVSKTMYGNNVEVAVASPIYVPGICEVFPQAFALFGAVSKHIRADFYVAHSSLADKVVEQAADQTGASLVDINSREFPLDLSTTDSRRKGVDEETLEKLTPLGLIIKGSGDNVQYGHLLKVSRMSYK